MCQTRAENVLTSALVKDMVHLRYAILTAVFFVALSHNGGAGASSLAIFSVTILGNLEQITFTYDPQLSPPPATEAPPVIISGGWRQIFFTTGYTWVCSTSQNPLVDRNVKIDRYCDYSQGPDIRSPSSRQYVTAYQLNATKQPWKRNYSGIFSAHAAADSKYKNKIIAIVHGENKNEMIGGQYYENTVNTNVSAHKCFSGIHDGRYDDCLDAYNGFISLSTSPYSERDSLGRGHFEDIGPVLWPSAGYLRADGSKATNGLRHPSSIIKDGYIYVFYLDGGAWGSPNISGRQQGIKVARAKLPATGVPRDFLPYYNGGFDPKNPSLPIGFDATKIDAFYAVKGGKADTLFEDSQNSFRFSVARLQGTSYFLGVDEYCDIAGNKNYMVCGLRLRLSEDLMHWYSPVPIDVTTVSNWQDMQLHYPVFLSATADSNYDIDPDNFWIIGTSAQYKLNAMHLKLSIDR